MKLSRFFLVLPVLGLALAACQQDIIVNLPTYEPQLSIESILEPGNVPKVYLNTTVPYFSPSVLPSDLFAKGAQVSILTNGDADVLFADSTFNQYTCQWQPFYEGSTPIRQGERYDLIVKYGGSVFEATTRTDVEAVSIDSVTYVEQFADLYGEHEGVVVDFLDLPGQDNFYRYRMDRMLTASQDTLRNCNNGTFPASEIGRGVYFDTGQDGLPVRFVIEPAFKHKAGDEAFVYVQSLDEASAKFFDELDKQKEAKINPFVEPVFIRSAIPGAIGVFGASRASARVRFVYPD